jgi:hypothetical protein
VRSTPRAGQRLLLGKEVEDAAASWSRIGMFEAV